MIELIKARTSSFSTGHKMFLVDTSIKQKIGRPCVWKYNKHVYHFFKSYSGFNPRSSLIKAVIIEFK